jgi:hypothetical protein
MREQLRRQGVDIAKIPPFDQQEFRDWLRLLFRTVPASRVMHGTLQIQARIDGGRKAR